MAERELTYGEKAVGVSFNPGGSPGVDKVKALYAEVIDLLDKMRSETVDNEQKRLLSIGITEAQGSQMWAVKGITWGL